ncbi:hypothetical protein GCM10011369_24030 [Neiella marina]|uniref:NADH:ubiquinone oxidoreductase intermediate-associated protein 30 domain-containing protein n=1 Tax=Neiella marina TaxID=508461 RepID=A0A8J2XPM5_9GAMM|nr:CIA30 family protein [Neiella marina]GGA81274.1 hypothetical protein GCM10011369_24030 [Neiella marina]
MIHFLTPRNARNTLLSVVIAAYSATAAATIPPVVDDFSDPHQNNLGLARQYLNDSLAGGSTSTEQTIADGVLSVSGKIVPPRGQPGWASSVLLLDAGGQPQDASEYQGIRLLIKVIQGTVSVSANSTEIDNFDYHAAPVMVKSDGQFHEFKVPFDRMKRAWSAPTPLNPATINSLSIVAYGVQPGDFSFELDEVSFY